jgi:glycerate kinase
VRRLEEGLRRWGKVLERASGRKILGVPRMGAAGGAAAALAAAGARLVSGAEMVLGAVGFDDALRRADAVLTGEGAVDRTTGEGKAVREVLRRAARAGVPAYVLAGRWGKGAEKILRGTAGSALVAPGLPAETSMRSAKRLMPDAAAKLVGLGPLLGKEGIG